MKLMFFGALAALFLFPFFIVARQQNTDLAKFNLTDSVPFNSKAVHQVLPNGLTCYLSKNLNTPGKIFVMLTIKAGIFQEEKNQPEIDHVVEHTLFRGNLHDSKTISLKQYLRDHGVTYYNGNTSLKYTQYYFEIPSDSTVLQTILYVFQDWIVLKKSFKEEDILAEKQIVVAETRQRGQVGYMDAARQLMNPSKFSETIKQDKSNEARVAEIESLSSEAINGFYQDWYRPDLGALIIVGDMNPKATEQIIYKIFHGPKQQGPKKIHTNYPIELTGENKYITDFSSDDHTTSLNLFFIKNRDPKTTYGHYREEAIAELFNKMMQYRLKDLYRKNNSENLTSVNASFDNGIYALNSLDVRSLQLRVWSNKTISIEAGLKVLFTETERLRRFGFNEDELENVRAEAISSLQQTENSQTETERYKEHFIDGEAAPEWSHMLALRHKFLSEISLQDINETVKSWITETDRSIVIQAPQSVKQTAPDKATALNWLSEIQQSKILPYEPAAKVKYRSPNFDSLYVLSPNVTYVRKDNKNLNITTLQLANGVQVVLKNKISPTDKTRIRGVRAGGTSGYRNPAAAKSIKQFITDFGPGELDKNLLDQYKEFNDITSRPEIDEFKSSVVGTVPSANQEALFQLIWRYFLEPRKDTAGTHDFGRKIYQQVFSDPAEFTFFITGVENMDQTIALVTKYLGNLQGHQQEHLPEIEKSFENEKPEIRTVAVSKKLKSERAEVIILYEGEHKYSWKEGIRQFLLKKVVESTCYKRLREKEAGIYAISANLTANPVPKSKVAGYQQKISFVCSFDVSDRLIKATQDEIELLKKNGPGMTEFAAAKDELKKLYTLATMDDMRWVYQLTNVWQSNEDFSVLEKIDHYIESLTPNDIKRAAQEYLTKKGFRVMVVGEGVEIK